MFLTVLLLLSVIYSDPEKAQRRGHVKERKALGGSEQQKKDERAPRAPVVPLTKTEIRDINQQWEDTTVTSTLFDLIKRRDYESFAWHLEDQPSHAHVRSRDGRGPMWWAHEHGRKHMVALLKSHGVSEKARDKDGITSLDLADDEL